MEAFLARKHSSLAKVCKQIHALKTMWHNVLFNLMRLKVKFCNYSKEPNHQKNTIPSVKHLGSSNILIGYFSTVATRVIIRVVGTNLI